MGMTEREQAMVKAVIAMTEAKLRESEDNTREAVTEIMQTMLGMFQSVCQHLEIKVVEQKVWCKEHSEIESNFVVKLLSEEEKAKLREINSSYIIVDDAEELRKREKNSGPTGTTGPVHRQQERYTGPGQN